MTSTELATYLVAIISHWAPAAVPSVPVEDVARDIAAAVTTSGPVWPGERGEKRSAVLLASLAYWEGARFAAYVDRLDCNRWQAPGARKPVEAQHLLPFGHCDHGKAFSLWQIWPRDDERAAMSDRFYAATRALELVKASYAARGNLSAYSGESADAHPKADIRERFAARYY